MSVFPASGLLPLRAKTKLVAESSMAATVLVPVRLFAVGPSFID